MKKIKNFFAVLLVAINVANPILVNAQVYFDDFNSGAYNQYSGYTSNYYYDSCSASSCGTDGTTYYDTGSNNSNVYFDDFNSSAYAPYSGYTSNYYYDSCSTYSCGTTGTTYYNTPSTYYYDTPSYNTGSTYYYNTPATYYNTPTTYYYNTPAPQPITCQAGYHLQNGSCIQDTKYCNGAQIPITQNCPTIVTPVVCNYPYVNQNGVCVTQTYICNGNTIPVTQTCQTTPVCNYPYIVSGNTCVIQTRYCDNGVSLPVNQDCPISTRICPGENFPRPVTQACPQQNQTCWDGSVIPTTSTCPAQYKTCLSGIVIPVTQTCGKYCANGVFVNETASCTRICPNGNSYPENVACPIVQNRPNVDLSISRNLISKGESVTLSWVSSNASSCTSSNAWSGSKAVNGSEVRYNLQGNSTFTITCYNVRGESASDTVFVNVKEIANINLSRVVTTVPTRVGKTVATCNGIGIIANNLSTTGWFEYGTTESLGNTTNVGNIGSGLTTPFSNTLSGLKSNTKYYCRAVIANAQGTFKGELMSFKTEGTAVKYIPPVVTHPPTKTPVKKPVLVCYDASGNTDDSLSERKALEISIEKYSGSLEAGAVVEYKVKYTNTSKITVSNSVLKVTLPKELQYMTSTRGNFNASTNEVNVVLGDIRSNESGEVFIRVKVADQFESGKTIVSSAQITYEVLDANKNVLRDDVTASTLATLGEKSMNTGDKYDNENAAQNEANSKSGSFLPDSILEWLAIIALIMILIFLGKRINDEFRGGKKEDTHGHH